ncbi:hypothetical protein BVRB_5g106810 [Beta vulgaris subsp. vulgaris]|nr:hypothetical protein BVRB_5g106810 [Beta vulgaris subsp. vulgaris]
MATTSALQGTGSGINSHHHPPTNNINNGAALSPDDFQLSSSQLLSLLDSKDEALHVLKMDLMDALNKQVKSLDEDSWMFEAPRSRINLISKPGRSFVMSNTQFK